MTVFTVLAIAQELGISVLEHSCEQHITGTLSAHNACGFYAAALQMEQELIQQGAVISSVGIEPMTLRHGVNALTTWLQVQTANHVANSSPHVLRVYHAHPFLSGRLQT